MKIQIPLSLRSQPYEQISLSLGISTSFSVWLVTFLMSSLSTCMQSSIESSHGFDQNRYISLSQRELSTSDRIQTNRFWQMRRRPPRSVQQLGSDLNCNFRRKSASSLILRAQTASLQSANKDDAILLVGVTGGTGSSVLNGLLTSGVESSRLRVLTRNPESNAARSFLAHGAQVIAGDLDDRSSVKEIVTGKKGGAIRGIY